MYKVGDKVKVKKFSVLDDFTINYMNQEGLMDKYIGQIVTIREVLPNTETDYDEYGGRYHIEEDVGENVGVGWFWLGTNFEPANTYYSSINVDNLLSII